MVDPSASASEVMTEAFHTLLLTSFKEEIADRLFSSLPSTPPWLMRLLADDGWARTFRELAREHSGSLFLGFVQRAMGEGERGREGRMELLLNDFERQLEDSHWSTRWMKRPQGRARRRRR